MEESIQHFLSSPVLFCLDFHLYTCSMSSPDDALGSILVETSKLCWHVCECSQTVGVEVFILEKVGAHTNTTIMFLLNFKSLIFIFTVPSWQMLYVDVTCYYKLLFGHIDAPTADGFLYTLHVCKYTKCVSVSACRCSLPLSGSYWIG